MLWQQAGLSVPKAAALAGYDERTGYRWEAGEVIPRKSVIGLLRGMKQCLGIVVTDPKFTFIDLFGGIGCLRRGFEPIRGKCVFTSKRDKYSKQTYLANFPGDDHEVAGDIMPITSDQIPSHDVLLAGFPCQPFSLAGVSKKNALNRPHGFACEAQGPLFFKIAEILRDHRPATFVLENVKNLVSHDKGNTFRVICETLVEELGYTIDWRVIDAKGFVPQHRERIFIVGFCEDQGFSFDDIELPDPTSGPKQSSILHSPREEPEEPYVGELGQVSPKYTLSDNLWGYLQDYAAKHKAKGNGFWFGLVGPKDTGRTLSARYHKDRSEILIDQGKGKTPRRLTPVSANA